MFQLEKGIFLEDKNTLLEWGQPLDKLAGKNNGEVVKQADRLIIYWGIHKILNGLEVTLSNTFLGTPNFLLWQKFTNISVWAVGDKEAQEFFTRVSTHLINTFGEPEKEDLRDENEKCWIWYMNEADIVLNFFEQHCFKSCLTIDQNL